MSQAEDMRYEIERNRRQEIFNARVRETTQVHLDRYLEILNDILQQQLDGYIPNEVRNIQQQLETIAYTLKSNPANARDLSMQIASDVHALPGLARAARQAAYEAERQAEMQRETELHKAREDLEYTWQDELSSWTDSLARQLAYPTLAEIRGNLMSPNAHTTLQQLRAALSSARVKHELQAQVFREREAEVLRSQTHHDAITACQAQVNLAEKTVPEYAKVLSETLANMADLPPEDFSAQLTKITHDLDNAVINETCRREVVRAVYQSLEGAGFVTEKPRRICQGDTDEVVIRGLRPSGAEAKFCVDLSGTMHYRFEHYQGTACKKDIDTVLPNLQSIYGIQLSDRRVSWENPDDIDYDARPRPETNEEQKRGR